ncbi:DUF6099 family protein [Kitasatospora sp. McL0602]|uniref:DUF6099 family protein n=1 Tax=Kitasatospora sp. McL0602 TaxID=3439530 RepID=UPI003F89375A
MEALRLIKTARHALAEARSVPDVLTEAWQAGMLTETIGARIAESENGEISALGQLLCDAGAHAVGSMDQPSLPAGSGVGDGGEEPDWSRADWTGAGRAGRLGELGELEPVLEELGRLLHDVAETLVVLACGAEGESLYWRCIDGVDAGSECKDLVAELLRTIRREPSDDADVDILACLDVDSARPGPDRVRSGPGADQEAEADAPLSGVPILLVPLRPPVAGRAYQPGVAEPVERSAGSLSSGVRVPDDCRSASRPARSALTELSSSCICSNRLLGAPADAVGGGVTGVSDQGSDMRGPLQLGSAV